jgi:hypothetical protein
MQMEQEEVAYDRRMAPAVKLSRVADLPEPFDLAEDTSWPHQDAQVEDWSSSDPDRFQAAVGQLTLQQIRAGISEAEEVSREHQRRAERAEVLANGLREAAHSAGDHGRAAKVAASY